MESPYITMRWEPEVLDTFIELFNKGDVRNFEGKLLRIEKNEFPDNEVSFTFHVIGDEVE